MTEQELVDRMVEHYKKNPFIKRIAVEVASLHRSADIAMIDAQGRVWVIECKISAMSKAIEQLKTHSLAADFCFIGTEFKNTSGGIINSLKELGFGLMYLSIDGSGVWHSVDPQINNYNQISRDVFKNRIIERAI